MHATAWKTQKGGNRYKIQINDIEGKRIFNRLYKEYSTGPWNVVGDGYAKAQGQYILLVARSFQSEEEWLEWARSVDLNLVEHGRNGRPKPIKLGTNFKKRRAS